MATEFPIDPNAGRFIEGLRMTTDGGAIADLPDEIPDVEELEDGSAIATLEPFKGPEEETDFYENLAEKVSPLTLSSMAMRYLELIEKDKEARKDRDKKYEEGLKRTGMEIGRAHV